MTPEEAEKDLYFKRLNECSFHTRSVTDQVDRVVKLSDAVILYALIKQSEVDSFKSALREEIENWKKHESQAMYPSYYYSGRQDALNNVLQLLDSVTPKK